MTAAKRHRVAIIGCGNIALAGHLPAVLAHPRFELTGLCDVRPERLDLMLRSCGAAHPATAADYRELLDKADAFILALQPEQSVAVAIDLLGRGRPVLDEKPLAVSVDEGRRVAQVVRNNACVYQVGFVMRYCSMFADVARWVAPLGGPRFYQVSIYDERPSQHVADDQRMIQGILARSSALTHEGSHVIDWMSLLVAATPIRAVMAGAIKTRPEYRGPNVWACNFDYADGSVLQLTIGWLLETPPRSTLRVLGHGGRLDLDLFSGTGELATGGRTEAVKTQPLQQEWAVQLDRFAEGIERGIVTGATVEDGLRALEATIAGERSAALRQAQNVGVQGHG